VFSSVARPCSVQPKIVAQLARTFFRRLRAECLEDAYWPFHGLNTRARSRFGPVTFASEAWLFNGTRLIAQQGCTDGSIIPVRA
jgi:hypothetical protein